ncbi:MAG TPA: methyltransferase domain-containing protein [Candidatus Acidoferrum sp.]|nr:methyltransferase domain-containing protein [Candidatus Acidoferrum sp.]
MHPKPWSPHGRALLDFFHGKASAEVVVHDEDGYTDVIPARVFFRAGEEFSALEEAALDLCRGRVLDAGAGAGCHSLALQERGLAVCAIDIAAEAVEVMRGRGVRDARRADIFRFRAEPFDTLLLLMNGIGVVGRVAGVRPFLSTLGRLLQPGGQILLDSFDPRPEDGAGAVAPGNPRRPRRYIGEMRFQLEYEGRKGEMYDWLFVDFETLAGQAKAAGWVAASIWHEEEGHYLARLTRAGRTA